MVKLLVAFVNNYLRAYDLAYHRCLQKLILNTVKYCMFKKVFAHC